MSFEERINCHPCVINSTTPCSRITASFISRFEYLWRTVHENPTFTALAKRKYSKKNHQYFQYRAVMCVQKYFRKMHGLLESCGLTCWLSSMKQGKLNYRGKINFRLLTDKISCAIKLLLWPPHTETWLVGCFSFLTGVHGDIVGSGTVLQARRLWIQLTMGLLECHWLNP